MFETVRIVEVAGILGEVGRVSDVQHLAFRMLHFLQCQRGLAAAGAADHDQRRRLAIDRFLCIVERNRFVQQMDGATFGMQIAHRLRIAHGFGHIAIGNPGLVDRRTAQETRLVVIVMRDDFQHQRAHLIVMAHQREQQPIGAIELGPVELAVSQVREFLDLGGVKVVAGDGFGHLAVGGLDARRVEADVFENFHEERGETDMAL